MNDQLLDATQVAELLTVSKETVLRLHRKKMIASVRVGTSIRFTSQAVADFIALNTVSAK